jgi:hypothetical protein
MILCDIDGVLAMGPAGDTAVGEPIYRTFPQTLLELQRVRDAGVEFHVVTARVQAEAVQVLEAIGIDRYVDSIISADRLFWPTVWNALRRGKLPHSLSKSGCSPLLPKAGGRPVVMIENHYPHLQDMLSAGVIDYGFLVPPIQLRDGMVAQWFDLERVLRLARELVTGAATAELGDLGMLAEQIGTGRYLFRLPPANPAAANSRDLQSLHTGCVLRRGSPNLVAVVRASRRFVRSVRGLVLPGRL